METNERLVKVESQLDLALERLVEVEKIQDDIHSLAQSIALLAQSVQHMQKTQDTLVFRMDSIEKKPVEDMNRIKWTVINIFVASVVAGFLTYLGLK